MLIGASGRKEESRRKIRRRIREDAPYFCRFRFDFVQRKTIDDTPEEHEQFYRELMVKGGFHYWLATYDDLLKDQEANDEAYNFWRKTVLKRIPDPKKQELLAPKLLCIHGEQNVPL